MPAISDFLTKDDFDFYMPAGGAAMGAGVALMTYGHNPVVACVTTITSVACTFLAFQALASNITKRLDVNAAKLQERIQNLESLLETRLDYIENTLDFMQAPSLPDMQNVTSQSEKIISTLQP